MNTHRAFIPILAASLGLACGGSAMTSHGSGGSSAGGQGSGGASASGGALGSGGAATGGILGSGGSSSVGGTKSGTGGGVTGGKGGFRTGGTVTGGTVTGGVAGSGGIGGTGGCPLIACPAIACLYGELPNPDPCGCPICAPPDAGVVKDASPDGCIALPCVDPMCGPGYVVVSPPCGCGTCVLADGGQPDATTCPPSCPAGKCAPGAVATVDACGCTVCGFPDAGADTGKLACVGLDECSCLGTKNCAPVAEACYCPSSQCTSVVCVCGGGRFLGCAPTDLNTCTAAKARVASLCPGLSGTTWDSLCQQSDSACITKCLDDVTACGDLSCSMCEACDCASDAFMRCRAACRNTVTQ